MKTQTTNSSGMRAIIVLIWMCCLGTAVFPQSTDEEMIEAFQEMKTVADAEQFIIKHCPNELAFRAVQLLTASFLFQSNWTSADSVYRTYKKYFPNMQIRFEKIIELLNTPFRKLKIDELGSEVNTKYDEYSPIIAANGQYIYFTRAKPKLVKIGDEWKKLRQEDIYVSRFNSINNSWEKAIELDEVLNTDSNEAPVGISADGNTLLLFGNYSGSLGKGDIFYTEKMTTGWSSIEHYTEPINSSDFEADAMMTADGKALLFISDRPGGIGEYHPKDVDSYDGGSWGNTDIYICPKTDSGWSDPINLGEIVNTPYSERSPFLHPDGKTLYFSSIGHYGLGNFDVFQTTRLSDTSWTEWSAPVNLGKEYNGSGVDWYYKISTKGDFAYFSVRDINEDNNNYDLYTIELSKRPDLVTTVAGKVKDSQGNPLSVTIKWDDLTLIKEAGEARSDPKTGEYFIALPAGHKYNYHAEKEGYIGKSEELDLTDKKEFERYTLDMVLFPIKGIEKDSLSIEIMVYFDTDSSDLNRESELELNRWVDILKKNSDLALEIHGHTDDTGSEKHNEILSLERANAVKNYFIGKGIAKHRIKTKGFGETRPIDSNDTEDGRQKNRRVVAKNFSISSSN